MTTAIEYPFTAEKVRGLKLGELVTLSGRIVTARDRAHKHFFERGECPVNLKDGAIYHCGPMVLRKDGMWITQAAGPTTSMRHEPYMPAIIERCNVRVIVGKGGMGTATQKACAKFGCVYLLAVGGAAQVLNDRIKKVLGVHYRREFGMTEAVWELEVADFPAIVTIDARGRNISQKVRVSSKRILGKLLRKGPQFGA